MAGKNYKDSLNLFFDKKKIIFILLSFIILILAVILFILNKEWTVVPKEEIKKEEVQNQNEAVMNFVPESIFNLNGTITEIDKNIITFNAAVPHLDEGGKKYTASEIRKIVIDDSTQIVRYVLQTNKETEQKEVIEKKLQVSDLKIGEKIEAISATDIKYEKEFAVIKIRILKN
jgi:hypothetical protein